MNRLTVGMATYEDFDGVYFTLEALRTYHGDRFDIVVVNNSPRFDKRLDKVIQSVGGKHYHRPDLVGTSAPRDAVFRFAQTPWVMVIDSHVLIEPGGVAYTDWWTGSNPGDLKSRDIHTGPIVGDDGRWVATHWNPKPGKTLDGVWSISREHAEIWKQGRATFDDILPFDIPMQGLGLWFAHKDYWPGFNYRFRGFGGEEGYIHERYRRLGGKALSHPRLRWRHRFRDIAGWDLDANGKPIAIVPYPLSLADHVWNLLVGHRELGIEGYEEAIWESHGRSLGRKAFDQLVKGVEFLQPFGETKPLPRITIRGVWYTNNKVPTELARASLLSIKRAADQSRHQVDVVTVPWTHISGNPFSEIYARVDLTNRTPHQQIISQIRQGVEGSDAEVVAFLEHDVIYPPDYFDRIALPFATNEGTQTVLNDSCIGLNDRGFLDKTAWKGVEPLHQMAMHRDALATHLDAVERLSRQHRSVNLEPPDSSMWVRVGRDSKVFPPSIHVNHHRRLTNHGEVCFNDPAPKPSHSFWGDAKLFWPKDEPTTSAASLEVKQEKPGGCGCQVSQSKFQVANQATSIEEWFNAERDADADFKEHMGTIADLASQVQKITVMSRWPKRAYLAAAYGLSRVKKSGVVTLTDVSPTTKIWWSKMTELFHGSFIPVVADPINLKIDPTDMLFLDLDHNGKGAYESLLAHHESVNRWIVLHATHTFGVQGETKGQVGVGYGVRRFLKEHPEWTVIRHDLNNHGLMVLSKDPRDKDVPPSTLRKALNFAQATVKHKIDGDRLVPPEVFEERINTCLTCSHRVHDACGACGCPIEKKASWASEECGLVKLGLPPMWKRHTEKEQES